MMQNKDEESPIEAFSSFVAEAVPIIPGPALSSHAAYRREAGEVVPIINPLEILGVSHINWGRDYLILLDLFQIPRPLEKSMQNQAHLKISTSKPNSLVGTSRTSRYYIYIDI